MLNPELWATGSTAMVVGMGIVFSFLIILVGAIALMARFVEFLNKVCPIPVVEQKTKKVNTTDNTDIALAIAVAVAQG